MKKFLYLLAAVIGPLCAARTPEETVQGVFAALSKGGLPAMVDFVHEYDIPEYRKYVSQLVEQARAAAAQDPGAQEVVKRLPPNFEKLQGREYVKAGMAAVGGDNPDTIKIFRSLSLQPLGHVREGNLAHVVVRLRIPVGTEVKQEIKVITVKEQSGDFWFARGSGGQNPFSQLFQK